MRLVLVRHPTPLIDAGVCYGRLDVTVAPAEVERIASDPVMAGARLVWSSPAVRCLRVAEAIAAVLDVPLRVDRRLWEVDFGDWEGRRWTTIEQAELDCWAANPVDFAPPGGETGAALIVRVRDFQVELREDCVVVSHGGPLKVLVALLRSEPIDLLARPPAIGSVTVIRRG